MRRGQITALCGDLKIPNKELATARVEDHVFLSVQNFADGASSLLLNQALARLRCDSYVIPGES
jgi:hypothetical protein